MAVLKSALKEELKAFMKKNFPSTEFCCYDVCNLYKASFLVSRKAINPKVQRCLFPYCSELIREMAKQGMLESVKEEPAKGLIPKKIYRFKKKK